LKSKTPRQRIERLLDLATRLPWWAGLLSAVVAYTLLHPIAVLQIPGSADLSNAATNAAGQLFIFLARIGQYLLPLVLLSIAVISGFHRRQHAVSREPTRRSNVGSLTADPSERALGEHLAALIRAEERISLGDEFSAPVVDEQQSPAPPSERKSSLLRARRIIDAVGILIALGALWGICVWFLTLPEAPGNSPWTLLGAGSGSAELVKRLHGLERSRSVRNLAGQRPLGQFQFGPPSGYLISEAQPPPVEPEPVEVYHSLRELETAFDEKYVPPPECYAYESNYLLVRCANHRIRTRRAFIESGGKVTATLLGSWEEPPSVVIQALPRDEQPYEQGDWQEDKPPEADPGSGETPEPEQDWRQEWLQQPDQDSDGDWRQEWMQGQPQGPDRNWQREDWQLDGEESGSPDWTSRPLPVERRHWVDDL
jgi:hypothetical protein